MATIHKEIRSERTRLVWIADLLPDEVAGPVAEMMEAGSRVIKRTLEAVPSPT